MDWVHRGWWVAADGRWYPPQHHVPAALAGPAPVRIPLPPDELSRTIVQGLTPYGWNLTGASPQQVTCRRSRPSQPNWGAAVLLFWCGVFPAVVYVLLSSRPATTYLRFTIEPDGPGSIVFPGSDIEAGALNALAAHLAA